jgi:uncharacterized membrane protein
VRALLRAATTAPAGRGRPVAFGITVGTFAAAYAAAAILKHRHFNSSYDLAIYDQAIWHLSRFEAPASSFRGMSNLFGDHFHPIIVLLAPLFWLTRSAEALLVAQALLLAASIVPVFLFARDRLAPGPALAVSIAYGFFWGLQQTATFDVHEAAFAPLAVGVLLLAMDRKQWRWFWAAAITVAAVKEDLSPFLAFLGGYLIVNGERRRGAILMVSSLAAFALLVGVVIPAASDVGDYGYRAAYSEVLRAPWRLPMMLVTPPLKLLTAFLWVAPFAMLPWASPLSVLLLPFAAERFLSASRNHWGTIFHYSAPLAPIVAMAAADGLARLSGRIQDFAIRRRMIVGCAAACVLLAALLPGHQPLWQLFSPHVYRFGPIERSGEQAIRMIPTDASVVAQSCFAPHVSHRSKLYLLEPRQVDADYVVGVEARSPWPLANVAEIRSLLDERQRRGYSVIFEQDGWTVLRRGPAR